MQATRPDGPVLFAPETFNLAETTRAIEVARALRDRHECVFAGYSERYADLVRQAGFPYRALTPVLTDDQADQLLRADQGKSVRHPFTTATVRARVRTELALIDELDVSAVVIGYTITQLLSARIAGRPLVFVKPFAYSPPHVSTMGSIPILAGSGPVARVVNRAGAHLVRAATERFTWKPRSFRVVAREHGLTLPRRTLDALDGDLNLLASLDPLLSGTDLPAGYEAAGPVFARLDGDVPDGVLASVAEARAAGRPVVYCAMGSSASRALVLRTLRALGTMPVVVVAPVRTYLRDGDLEELRTVAPRVHVVDLLPAHRLGGLVDAAVIHGGEGTVQTAVATGVPFVGIGLQMEQRWNIDDCVRRGVAVGLGSRDVGRPAFRRAVHQVVTDPGVRQRSRALAEQVAGIDGAAHAAQAIHRLLSPVSPPAGCRWTTAGSP